MFQGWTVKEETYGEGMGESTDITLSKGEDVYIIISVGCDGYEGMTPRGIQEEEAQRIVDAYLDPDPDGSLSK